MKVWIDQDLCTGDGLCEEIAPDVFTLLDDGLAYVKEGDKVYSNPGGSEGMANIPDGQLDATLSNPGRSKYKYFYSHRDDLVGVMQTALERHGTPQ